MEILPSPGVLFTILMFVAMISPLVFIHEMGHYLAGRMFNTAVDSFSIGFGREIFGWTNRRGERWKVGWLPLGGYVKFTGDANAASMPQEAARVNPAEKPFLFAFKPLWQRAIIVAAGPFVNFAAAILIFATFIAIYGQSYTSPVVSNIVTESAADRAGLAPGDRILKVDGKTIERFEEIIGIVMINPGTPVSVDFERAGAVRNVVLTPDLIEEKDRFGKTFKIPRIGLIGEERGVIERGPLESLWYGTEAVFDTTGMMVKGLVQIVTGQRSMKELGGPLKIAEVSGQAGTMGIESFVNLMALVSINLGFINLLPIPMLDGGHLAIYAAEAVRRKPIPPRVQEWAFMTGFALLISFMLIVTWNDLASFGVFKHVAGLIG
ncbi:RIP metalloprotease RseP [Sphingosinicella microcystinivorans]|uniref:Zinc metalloprotease n=1 Tax=Sphingosinicella microcystinivorans TaxID=335406 RepID=A0AAD1D7P1_SPHMI|nr:site-2 protease [Sphingosinicella microcystinivorans]BBE35055.1 putative zinc metalloprotease R01501 [Sphingosinicella microcystinivorans]